MSINKPLVADTGASTGIGHVLCIINNAGIANIGKLREMPIDKCQSSAADLY